MPLYEYRCKSCGEVFERLRRMQEADDDLVCPACDSQQIERLLSAFSQSLRSCSGGRFT